jgi:hypothetical protein
VVLWLEPIHGCPVHPKGAGNFHDGFTGFDAVHRLPTLVRVGRPKRTPRALVRSRPSPVQARISVRSNSASPPRMVSMSCLCGVVVSAQVSLSERPAPACMKASRTLRRSRVERARRSKRVTIDAAGDPPRRDIDLSSQKDGRSHRAARPSTPDLRGGAPPTASAPLNHRVSAPIVL